MTTSDMMHENAEAYVLGALESSEREAFDAHLKSCDQCRDACLSYIPVLRGLNASRRDASPVTRPTPRRFRVVAAALACVLFVVGAGLGAWSDWRAAKEALTAAAVAAQAPRIVALHGPRGAGRVFVDAKRGYSAVLVRGLPPPPSGSEYRVWSRGVGSLPDRFLGTLHASRGGLLVSLIANGQILTGVRAVLVDAASASEARIGPNLLLRGTVAAKSPAPGNRPTRSPKPHRVPSDGQRAIDAH